MKSLTSCVGQAMLFLWIVVGCGLLVQTTDAASTKVQTHRPAQSDTLFTILRDLEDAVVRLKEFALKADLEMSRKEDGDIEAYPEFVAELKEKKTTNDEPGAKNQPSKEQVPPKQSSKPGESGDDDISLKEALEFLVSLAKQKKQQRRDHDIPFPLNTDKTDQ